MKRLIASFLVGACASWAAAPNAFAQASSQQTPPASSETRPATTTFLGDTGLWFVPTGEILPPKGSSFSAYYYNFDRQEGFTDVGNFLGTYGYGVGRRAEIFASVRFVTRIDRDFRPLYDYTNTAGGPVNDHPLVSAAVATVREDSAGTRRLVAYIVARHADTPPDRDELRRTLGEHLPEYMVPASWVFLSDLPLNANGKIDRDALPPPELHGAATEADEELRSPTEQAMAALWCEVLRVDRVGIHDDFIRDLGGHSLLATQLVSRMRREFDVDLPLSALFAHPTIAGLAPAVEELILNSIEELTEAEADRLQQ